MGRRDRSEGGVNHRLLPAAVAAAATGSIMLSANALGCPRCYTAQVARAMVFGPGFWFHLLAIASPFVVLAAVSLACARIGVQRSSGDTARP
jgi:hypothetical protein